MSKRTAARTRPKKRPVKRVQRAASRSKAVTLAKGAAAGAVAAIARRLPWARDENDPIVLLKADHRRFEALLRKGEETTERAVKGRTRLLDTLTAELSLHELIEEKVLYPALKSHPEARDIVLEGYQEHHVADLIVKELHGVAKDTEKWGAKFKVLKESLEHHIKEEEHDMFPTARAVFSRAELNRLGVKMKALRRQTR